MNRFLSFALGLAVALTLAATPAAAQATAGTFAEGLNQPVRIIATPEGALIVAEVGDGSPNSGRISILDEEGARRTLIDGLPSGIAAVGDPSGPSGVALRGRTLFVTIGEGDATIPGPVPNSLQPNPSPSSPLFSAVLALRLAGSFEETAGGFSLSFNDLLTLKRGGRVRLTNEAGERLTVDRVADFRDFTFEPRPDFINNVRVSNPFGIAISGDSLFVTDASQNALLEVDIASGATRVLLRFAPKANPLPFGPPFAEAVPDNVRVLNNRQLLVTFLTGFPFAPGTAEVRRVNRINNSHVTLIGGLSSAIDVLPVEGPNRQNQFFTLEFSTDFLQGAPGRLQFFESAGAAPAVLSDTLVTPTSMAQDPQSGDIFITEISTGRVIRVQIQ